MIVRGQNFKEQPINVVGSSTFGRYPKISQEKTYNMFISDDWLVNYSGYQMEMMNSFFKQGKQGRGIHTSTKFGRMVVVIDNTVYLVNLFFDIDLKMSFDKSAVAIGILQTSTGDVFITENNRPQIVISDGVQIYYYDPTLSPPFQIATADGTNPINFTPGFVDFHDTYILCAASDDNNYSPPANNTWRLGIVDGSSGKLFFGNDAASVGLLKTKPDNTQAVVRVPSRGNQIFVLGNITCEPWYDVGYQLFPYQRSSSFSVDYGCLNPSTIASTDEIVVWLAQNEKAGPIIVYSRGEMPTKITTDGIDYFMSQLSNPADAEGFIFRQDGHLIYHINFYTDNVSLFYDFNTDKFFHACDENLNYFIASEMAFFNNQYYFVSRNNGNLYAFDTIFTTYDGAEIPRFRICKAIRDPSQEYFVVNDLGFTIEQGETPVQQQFGGDINLITEDGKYLITEGDVIFLNTENNLNLITEDGNDLISEQSSTDFDYLITEQGLIENIWPRVDLSISIDGGESFSSDMPYVLNPQGYRKNKLQWWQLGIANDFTPQFKFWGLGRFVATDGVANIRQ